MQIQKPGRNKQKGGKLALFFIRREYDCSLMKHDTKMKKIMKWIVIWPSINTGYSSLSQIPSESSAAVPASLGHLVVTGGATEVNCTR